VCYNQTVTQLSDLEGNPIPSLKHYEEERDALLKEIQTIGDMRRGTLIERYIPCGRKGCRCTRPGNKGHGPKYSLTYKVEGKTITEYIRADQVKQVREQVANHQRFRTLYRKLVEVNEKICRLRFEEDEAEDAKKNSAGRSRKMSPKRSITS